MRTFGIKVVENNIIPFKGFKAMVIYKWMFCRPGTQFKQEDYTHEGIHLFQQTELLIILFYLWYGIEYIIKLLICWNFNRAYRSICFEQEAYAHEDDMDWITRRPEYCWLRYVFKLSKKKGGA